MLRCWRRCRGRGGNFQHERRSYGRGLFRLSRRSKTRSGENCRHSRTCGGQSRWRVEEWNPEDFAQEQIRGLVRRVFFGTAERVVRQVVFSAVEPETDVQSLCRRVGEVLAAETAGTIAVAGNFPIGVNDLDHDDLGPEDPEHGDPENDDAGKSRRPLPPKEARDDTNRLRQSAIRVRRNLWLVPVAGKQAVSAASLHQYLSQVRREFEYSIVAARSAGESNQALAMAQFADGIILVLSAQHTRRATALRIKRAVEGSRARLMGTVLSDRVFPMPEALYRRL
jgi:hypothetical protein